MDFKLVFWIISLISFWGYALWYLLYHEIPTSWSVTFYNLQKIYKRKSIGYVYVTFLWISLFALLPAVMDTSPLLFIPIVAIALVGATMDTKLSKSTEKIHVYGTIGGILTMLAIMALPEKWSGLGHWEFAVPTLLVIGLFQWKKTKPKNNTTWIESVAMGVAHYVTYITCVL